MKWIKRFFILALVAFVVMQFIRPTKNEGDKGYTKTEAFFSETKPVPEVAALLKETCFDCHSDQTRYPWYAEVAPVSYWLADHIKNGSKHLNFSKWSEYSVKRKDHKLEEVIEMVEDREMPLDSYTWTHEEARLTDAQVEALITWAKAARANYGLQTKPQ